MNEHQLWQEEAQRELDKKAGQLTEKQSKLYQIDLISRAIIKIPHLATHEMQLQEFKDDTMDLILSIPTTEEGKKIYSKAYTSKISAYKAKIMKQYGLVTNGYYIAIWMPMGIAIGLSFGVALKNIALGIPIGIGIGVAIGSGLNAKAVKENKVL